MKDEATSETKEAPDQFEVSVILGRIEQGLTELKGRVDALEEAIAERAGTTIVPLTDAGEFDFDALVEELVQQGVPERDALEQATYKRNLWNDQHHR